MTEQQNKICILSTKIIIILSTLKTIICFTIKNTDTEFSLLRTSCFLATQIQPYPWVAKERGDFEGRGQSGFGAG